MAVHYGVLLFQLALFAFAITFAACVIKRKRSEAAKARAKEKYRAKRKFTRQVMKNIIACDSAFCSEVKVMHVKPVNPIEELHHKHLYPSDVLKYNMKLIHYGTVIGVQGQMPVLWVHCIPFSTMTQDEKLEFQLVLDYMREHSKLHNPIYCNGAAIQKNKETKKILGVMYGAGWRGAQVQRESFGVYKPNPTAKNDADRWKQNVEQQPVVAEIYRKWFERVSVSAYERAKLKAQETSVPVFGSLSWPPKEGEEWFGSNLTYTYGGFSNVQHLDKDENDYTFGIWFPCTSEDFKLASHADGFECSGGQFLWSELGVGVDFAKNDGVTLLIWRGQHDLHGTTRCIPKDGFTMMGSSVQISAYLVRKVQLHLERAQNGDPHNVGDVSYNYAKLV